MNYAEHKFSLDLQDTVTQEVLRVKKGDSRRRLCISLTNGCCPYRLSEDSYVVFTALKPDGNVVFHDCTVDNHVVVCDVPEQATAAPGLLKCEVQVYGDDFGLLTTARFTIIVEDTIYNSETEVESSSEFNALAQLISEARKHSETDVTANYEKALSAEEVSSAREYLWTLTPGRYYLEDAANNVRYHMQAFEDDTGGVQTRQLFISGDFCTMEFTSQEEPDGIPELRIEGETGDIYQNGIRLNSGGSGGLAFDSGYVDDDGKLHLTADGKDINGFTPFFVGNGKPEVYIGTGDMPEGYSIQIDPEGEIPELATKAYVDSLMGNLEAELEALL